MMMRSLSSYRSHLESVSFGRAAYSLVELLVTIGIFGILVSLTLPAVQRARSSAARMACANNQRQIGLALHSFHGLHGRLPPLPAKTPGDPNKIVGWMALILAQLDQNALWLDAVAACRVDPNPLNDPPHTVFRKVVTTYVCAADRRLEVPLVDKFGVHASFSSYIGISSVFAPSSKVGMSGAVGSSTGCRFSDISDGLSHTILVGERPPPDSLQAGWWYPYFHFQTTGFRGPNNGLMLGGPSPFPNENCVLSGRHFGPGRTDNPCDRYHLWSLHPGGANFLFADGSVQYYSYSAERAIIALASRSGADMVEDW